MRLINKDTGEQTNASAAGAELLLARGTHEQLAKPKTKTAAAKKPAAAEPDEE